MPSRRQVCLFAGALLLIMVAAMTTFKYPVRDTIYEDLLRSRDMTSKLRHQRILMSRELNRLKQQLGQHECTLAKLQNSNMISSGWQLCQRNAFNVTGVKHWWILRRGKPKICKHLFDNKLADMLGKFLTGKTVGSFGDGPGMYRETLLHQGLVASYESYDGAPFCENVTGGAVRFMDLTLSQYGLPVYDWVVCLEVAEHVPARYERVLVDNIARHARQGVILSWGHPGQGGFHHVNNKSPADVKLLLDEAGFSPDDHASGSFRNSSTFSWFRENIFVFRRKPETLLADENA